MHRRHQTRFSRTCTFFPLPAVLGLLVAALTGCSGIKAPSVPKVPSWVPVIGSEPSEPEFDPRTQTVPTETTDRVEIPAVEQADERPVPPQFTKGLQPGSTLRVAIFEGLRSTSRVFNASLTIDEQGMVTHRQLGSVLIAGMEIDEALNAIESAYRLTGRPSAQATTTHLFDIDGSGVVQIRGAVQRAGFIPHSGGITLGEALQQGGGFGSGANPGKLYVIRRGLRQLLYLSDEATLGYRLNEGDIVSVPWAL